MSRTVMHKLYFVRMVNKEWSNVVFLLTAKDEEQAKVKGMEQINPSFVDEFHVDKVEFVCLTPTADVIFEPV